MNSVPTPQSPRQQTFVASLRNLPQQVNTRQNWHLVDHNPDTTGPEFRSIFQGTFREISGALEDAGYRVGKVDTESGSVAEITLNGKETGHAIVIDVPEFEDTILDMDLDFRNAVDAVGRVDCQVARMDSSEMMTEGN